jgi:hypothetical protein
MPAHDSIPLRRGSRGSGSSQCSNARKAIVLAAQARRPPLDELRPLIDRVQAPPSAWECGSGSRVRFDGLSRVQEMAVCGRFATGAELPKVDLLVPDWLPSGLDGELVFDHRRDEAVSLEE